MFIQSSMLQKGLSSRRRPVSFGAATVVLAILLSACGQVDSGQVDIPVAQNPAPVIAGVGTPDVAAPAKPSDHQRPPGKTRVLTQFAGGTLTRLSAKGTMTFDRPMILPIRAAGISAMKVDDVTELEPGDIIVTAPTDTAPYGFIRKVEGVTGTNGEVMVTTSSATLEDAIKGSDLPAGDYHLSEPVQMNEVVAAYVVGQDGQLAAQGVSPTDGPTDPGFYALPLPQKGLKRQGSIGIGTGTGDQCIDLPLTINEGGFGSKACFNLSARANLDLQIGIAWAWIFPYPTVNQFSAKFVGNAMGSLNIKTGISHQFFSPIKMKLAGYTFAPVTFWIGPLPVVMVPQYEITLNANGTVSANAHFDLTARAHAELGAEYIRDVGWNPANIVNVTFDPVIEAGSAFNVNFTAGLENTASLMFFGSSDSIWGGAGPKVSFMPYFTAYYDFQNGRGQVKAGTTGKIGIQATKLFSILSFEYPFFNYEWPIASF
jgi:hypothetical protein